MGISLQEVSFSYNPKKKNTTYSLNNATVDINDKDEFIAIIGKTGSGKSTLSMIFNGLRIPTTGKAVVYGIELKKKRSRKDNYNLVRKHVGLVFQFSDYQLFEDTVLKDVSFGPLNFKCSKEEALEKAKVALNLVGLDESFYDKSPLELSGGEKRLASIAGILALDPDILVFDEPTSGLDPATRNNLLDLFEKLNKEEHKSIVFITHNMNFVYEKAKRVLLLKDKRIVYDGNPDELFNERRDLITESSIDLPDVIREIELLKSLNVKVDEKAKTIKSLAESINE